MPAARFLLFAFLPPHCSLRSGCSRSVCKERQGRKVLSLPAAPSHEARRSGGKRGGTGTPARAAKRGRARPGARGRGHVQRKNTYSGGHCPACVPTPAACAGTRPGPTADAASDSVDAGTTRPRPPPTSPPRPCRAAALADELIGPSPPCTPPGRAR